MGQTYTVQIVSVGGEVMNFSIYTYSFDKALMLARKQHPTTWKAISISIERSKK